MCLKVSCTKNKQKQNQTSHTATDRYLVTYKNTMGKLDALLICKKVYYEFDNDELIVLELDEEGEHDVQGLDH